MKQLKAASLSSSLLLLKGRTNPAALVDQILGELNAIRPTSAPASAQIERIAPAATTRPRDRAEPAVVVPWQNAAAAVRRPVLEALTRKKLSLRLDRVRHFRMKLVAYHLGVSAQEMMTRALDSYIEKVAPDMAHTKPLPSRESAVPAGHVSADVRSVTPSTASQTRNRLASD